ncbi:MAG: hypothetical protein PHE73_08635 [Sulfurovaceae bacterium]|nr:hypothetical protein [Sulfurovaceae bacterium]
MIDLQARKRLVEDRKNKSLISSMKNAIVDGLKNTSQSGNEEIIKLVVKREEEQELITLTEKIGKALAIIHSKIPQQISLPNIFQVKGRVQADIQTLPPVKVSNFSEIEKHFKALEVRLGQMATAISMIAVQKPPEMKIQKIDFKPIIEAIKDIPVPVVQTGEGKDQDMLYEIKETLVSILNRPQMTVQPSTHMSINGLDGTFKATTLNVGSTATKLPSVNLTQRRGMIVYNNSANTIYIGDSNVAVAGAGQGLPVTSGSYSPTLDAGAGMILYGIASSLSSVTIFEMSDQASGR